MEGLVDADLSTAADPPQLLRAAPMPTIELRIDPSQVRRWHLDLVNQLERAGAGRIVAVTRAEAESLPSAVEMLLALERMIFRLAGPRGVDRMSIEDFPAPTDAEQAEIAIDLTGRSGACSTKSTLRPLFDGLPGSHALAGALLAGRAPTIDIEDTHDGSIRARGLPSLENAESLAAAMETVQARVATLLVAALRRPHIRVPRLACAPAHAGARQAAEYARRTLALAATRKLYRLCCYAPHWRVGWRFVRDRDLIDTQTLEGTSWNVLPDPGHRFYADPVPFVWQGRTFLFVEDLDHRTGKGIISVVEFDRTGAKGTPVPVLEEPWHLSYPFLIEDRGAIWMVPESSANRNIALYRADPFPYRWVREATLLENIEASDATILRARDRLWMFTGTRDGAGAHSDTLSLFSAASLLGPWRPHPNNPLLVDARSARPAGNLVRRGGRLWRPVQDCSRGYGSALGIAEVTKLDDEGFEQVVHTVLWPGASWRGRRFHTLNRAGDLEFIDGSAHSPKPRLIARAVEDWSGRRAAPPVSF